MINDYRTDAIKFSSDLKKMFEIVDGDLEKVRVMLCKAFGYNG